jgi:hypothetical protein
MRPIDFPEPKSPQEALVLALLWAIEAETERSSKIAQMLVTDIMDEWGLSARDLRRAQASANMILKADDRAHAWRMMARELQVEGKSAEDLMREGTLLFRGPVGEANRNVDDVVIWLWTLAENPEEVIRLLEGTPKKAKKSAQALYKEIRKRHKGLAIPTGAPRNFDSLQGLIYLNLFCSQIAPDPEESAYLFMRAAEVLSRAFEQNLTFTQEDLAGVVQWAKDSVRASMAMQDLVDSSPVGEANQRNTVTVIPAYGRDYKSKKDVLTDWKAGKDFIIYSYGHRYDGKYINKEDADRAGETVSIRYAGRTKQLIIRPG